ncbi:MAG: hypothetical protein ACKESB_02165 [Candidatus Hodgkinia cicadicola]
MIFNLKGVSCNVFGNFIKVLKSYNVYVKHYKTKYIKHVLFKTYPSALQLLKVSALLLILWIPRLKLMRLLMGGGKRLGVFCSLPSLSPLFFLFFFVFVFFWKLIL